MNVVMYDPGATLKDGLAETGNEYFSIMFAKPMRTFCPEMKHITNLDKAKDSIVVILSDNLSEERITRLKNNGCKIAAFNVTDSSYFSESIRHCNNLEDIDLIFMVSGIPITNESKDIRVTPDFEIQSFDRPFVTQSEWGIFHRMHKNRQLSSLPYVSWGPIPDPAWLPYEQRAKSVILRGGGHGKRYLLGLFLLRDKLLDTNSALQLFHYYKDEMHPTLRLCDTCCSEFRQHKRAPYVPNRNSDGCTHPAVSGSAWSMDELGFWNNRCARAFYWMAEQFQKRYGPLDMSAVESFVNGRWLSDKENLNMQARTLFTSDLKWIHSIYAPQRFWQGAAAGCINLLPSRTKDQEYFPAMEPWVHYVPFNETMEGWPSLTEDGYKSISTAAKELYEKWLRPSSQAISTNLLTHIFQTIREA